MGARLLSAVSVALTVAFAAPAGAAPRGVLAPRPDG